jgi:hypothetical protein
MTGFDVRTKNWIRPQSSVAEPELEPQHLAGAEPRFLAGSGSGSGIHIKFYQKQSIFFKEILECQNEK